MDKVESVVITLFMAVMIAFMVVTTDKFKRLEDRVENLENKISQLSIIEPIESEGVFSE